jgi:hypothetical protein
MPGVDLEDGRVLAIRPGRARDSQGVSDRRIHIEGQDWDVDWQTHKWVEYEYSSDSKIRIRCTDGLVEVSGNPSKIGGPAVTLDSEPGVARTIPEALRRFNWILEEFAIPRFFWDQEVVTLEVGKDKQPVRIDNPPELVRLDLAEDYRVTPEDQRPHALRSLSTVTPRGRLPRYANQWGTGWVWTYKTVKYYDKTKESGLEDSIIRHELGMRSRFLLHVGLRTPPWDLDLMSKTLRDHRFHEQVESTVTDFRTVFDELVALGYSETVASRSASLSNNWLMGVDVSSTMTAPTYRRYRGILRKVGVNLDAPCDVSALPRKIRHQDVIFSRIAA